MFHLPSFSHSLSSLHVKTEIRLWFPGGGKEAKFQQRQHKFRILSFIFGFTILWVEKVPRF
jgi:hypothetical protein